MSLSRRQILRGAGAALALPLLESMMPRRARAGTMPTRLVVFTTGEGTLLPRWTPRTLSGDALELSELLRPLAPHQGELVVISGVSNLLPRYHHSNGHNAPGHTLLSATLCETSATPEGSLLPGEPLSHPIVAAESLCVGPSIDHYLASQIGSPRPINLAVNGENPGENRMYYQVVPERPSEPRGARASARLIGDPRVVFDEFLAGTGSGEPTTLRSRIRGQRGRVLDAVGGSLASLSSRVSAADRRRLEAHASRIEEIEASLAGPAVSCGDPQLTLPPGYPATGRADLEFKAQIDVMVQALACGVTRVASVHDSGYHDEPMPFLQRSELPGWLEAAGAIPLPGGPIEGWHAQVHGDVGGPANDNPNLIAGFTYYGAMFSYLLSQMRAVVEPDGSTLLDNSLVLWISEFGNGSWHSSEELPVVLAGRAGGRLATGRHLARSGFTTGDLFTSILRTFEVEADSFGLTTDSDLQHGGIPGLA